MNETERRAVLTAGAMETKRAEWEEAQREHSAIEDPYREVGMEHKFGAATGRERLKDELDRVAKSDYAAIANLSFLLSVIRSGERLSEADEQSVRAVMEELRKCVEREESA